MQKQHLWVLIFMFQTHIAFVLSICGPTEFTCYSGKCIPTTRLCDDTIDCDQGTDGEDELLENCQNKCPTSCSGIEGQFQCDDCTCVVKINQCSSQETTNNIPDTENGNLSTTVIVLCIIAVVVVAIFICGVIIYKKKHKKKQNRIHPDQDQNGIKNDHQQDEQRSRNDQLALQGGRDKIPERRGNRRLPPIQNLSRGKHVNALYSDNTQLSMNNISVHASLDREHEL